MGVNCFDINKEFIIRLAKTQKNYAFNNYNYLWTKDMGKSGSSHCMVELIQGDYHIGVDIAAEQYRKSENKNDNVAAEITIATSFNQLSQILHSRHQIDPKHKWEYMPIEKKSGTLKGLQTYYPDLKTPLADAVPSEDKTNASSYVPVKPSGRCVIL